MSLPFPLWLYRTGTQLASPFAGAYLRGRARRGKEDLARLGERFGRARAPRPDGPLLWLHGASVGEMGVLMLLRDALAARDPALNFLMTTGTRASAELFARRAPERTQHAYSPLDTPAAVTRFAEHWRPDFGVFAESELWPNLLMEASERRIPLALVNATLSTRTLENWRRRPAAARRLLDAFALMLAAEARSAAALSELSGRAVAEVGNLKFAAPPLAYDADALAALRSAVGARPVWLAASTHEGEDDIVLAAHTRLMDEQPDALLIIAPRHVERGARIAARAGDAPRRALGALPGQEPVYVADTLGELGLFYALAPVSLVGGSLLDSLEGHNPIEPAKLGSAILSGPHVASFADAYDALGAAGGARIVSRPAEIAAAVAHFWNDEAARRALTEAARRAAKAGDGALEKTISALDALPQAPARATA